MSKRARGFKMLLLLSAFLRLLEVRHVVGVALGLLGEDGGYAATTPPYLASLHPLHHHLHYLHLDHLHGMSEKDATSSSAPRGVRPVLLTSPVSHPDPRPPPRPHPYSLLYLHYVPLTRLSPQHQPQQPTIGLRRHHRPYKQAKDEPAHRSRGSSMAARRV